MAKIVHVLTSTAGGAGIAAVRLHRGLQRLGHHSLLICGGNASAAQPAIVVEPATPESEESRQNGDCWSRLQAELIEANRTAVSNTLFSLGYPGVDISDLDAVRSADILHLHWVPRLLSIRTIEKLLKLGKPTFWTLHDYWPMTAGNHFPAGETDHEVDGAGNAHLYEDHGLSQLLLADKSHSFDYSNLHIIGLCAAQVQAVRRGAVFRRQGVSLGTNSVDLDVFKPLSTSEVRRARFELGVREDSLLLLIVAQDIAEKRKGFSLLTQAVDRLIRRAAGRRTGGHVTIAMIGEHPLPPGDDQISTLALKRIQDEAVLAQVFGAADFLVHPAQEETFGLVVLEALASGVPALCFDNGGSRELLRDGVNGFVLPGAPSLEPLVAGLAGLLELSESDRAELKTNARRSAEGYGLEASANKTLEIYAAAAPEVDLRSTLREADAGDRKPALIVKRRLPIDMAPSAWLAGQWLPPAMAQLSPEPQAQQRSDPALKPSACEVIICDGVAASGLTAEAFMESAPPLLRIACDQIAMDGDLAVGLQIDFGFQEYQRTLFISYAPDRRGDEETGERVVNAFKLGKVGGLGDALGLSDPEPDQACVVGLRSALRMLEHADQLDSLDKDSKEFLRLYASGLYGHLIEPLAPQSHHGFFNPLLFFGYEKTQWYEQIQIRFFTYLQGDAIHLDLVAAIQRIEGAYVCKLRTTQAAFLATDAFEPFSGEDDWGAFYLLPLEVLQQADRRRRADPSTGDAEAFAADVYQALTRRDAFEERCTSANELAFLYRMLIDRTPESNGDVAPPPPQPDRASAAEARRRVEAARAEVMRVLAGLHAARRGRLARWARRLGVPLDPLLADLIARQTAAKAALAEAALLLDEAARAPASSGLAADAAPSPGPGAARERF